jgi:fructokinase
MSRVSGLDELAARVADAAGAEPRGHRLLVALAGPPAVGKSTLAEGLAEGLSARGAGAVVVPMDGFHLDNRVLERRGLLARKGAPETFDAAGFLALVRRLGPERELVAPVFDRARDIAIAGALEIRPEHRVAVVEGNYLLFDAPVWRDLARYWDMSVRIAADIATLEARLVARWRTHGHSEADALRRARGNDLANARTIMAAELPATWVLESDARV